MKFTIKRPRYSGIYIAVQDNEYVLLALIYNPKYKDWAVSDYPHYRVTSSLEEYEGVEWGPRLPQ